MKKFRKAFCGIFVMLVVTVVLFLKTSDSTEIGRVYAAQAYECTTESYARIYEETTTSAASSWTENGFITTEIDSSDPIENTTYKHDVITEWNETTRSTTTSQYNQVESIYISNMTLVADNDGYWDLDYYWDEVNGDCYYEYYRYYIYPNEITVIFSDGTSFTGSVDDVYSKTGHMLSINDSQSYENQWNVGDYYVSATLGEARTTYRVTIIDTPVERIDVKLENSQYIENVDGYSSYMFDEDGEICNIYFVYDVWKYLNVNVVFKEGFEHYEDSYGCTLDDGQSYYTPWGIGKHTVTVSCLGYEKDFEVEVVANPNNIVSVSAVAQNVLYEGFDGHYIYDYIYDEETQDYTETTCFDYDLYRTEPLITITYEDGRTVFGSIDEIAKETGLYPSLFSNQNAGKRWEIGINTAYVELGDKVEPYEVEVFASLVKNIELINGPKKTEYVVGEYPDLTGAVIRINYVSGAFFDVELDDSESKLVFDNMMNRVYRISIETGTDSGAFISTEQKSINVVYGSFLCECNVSVKTNPSDKIIINCSAANELLITFYNTDGTFKTMTVLGFFSWAADGNDEFVMSSGRLYIDSGVYNATIYKYNNGLYCVEMISGDGNELLRSNYLNECPWMDAWFIADDLVSSIICCKTEQYSGEITKENIDDIVFQALQVSKGMFSFDNYPYFDGKEVREAIKNAFDVEQVNLSLSDNYNAQNDTIKSFTEYGGWGRILEPYNIQYKNDTWIFDVCFSYSLQDELTDEKYLHVVLDRELRIKSYNIGDKPTISELSVEIRNPSKNEITYGDSITLHADIAGTIPDGATIHWYANNNNFSVVALDAGKTCKLTSQADGETEIKVEVIDADGGIIAEDTQIMTSKAGFFDKVFVFFKKMFDLFKSIFKEI